MGKAPLERLSKEKAQIIQYAPAAHTTHEIDSGITERLSPENVSCIVNSQKPRLSALSFERRSSGALPIIPQNHQKPSTIIPPASLRAAARLPAAEISTL